MSSHAPYIMPDGRSLAAVLRAEGSEASSSTLKRRQKPQGRAKDELWSQLQNSKRTTACEQELAEIRAIERVGHRRRRQWLNDKLLRDLAGPMNTHDMEGQFKPVPFGIVPPPSAFTLAAAPEHTAIWDHFRSIDSDKQARVLQAWEAHNRQQQHDQHHTSASSAIGTGVHAVLHHEQQQAAMAAAALAKWSRVDRNARAALKKASVGSVLALEMQALQLLEQDDPKAELLLELPDSFARLLMHGLAQFHSLHSCTCISGGQKKVRLQCRQHDRPTQAAAAGAIQAHHVPAPQLQQQQVLQPQQSQPQGQCTPQATQPGEAEGSAAQGPSGSPAGIMAAGGGGISTIQGPSGVSHAAVAPDVAAAAAWLLHTSDITCTDIIMALQEAGGSLNHHTLGHHINTLHGSASGDGVCQ